MAAAEEKKLVRVRTESPRSLLVHKTAVASVVVDETKESRRFEDQEAKRPWPTKAVLSKHKAAFVDDSQRMYYLTSSIDLGENTREWVSTRMESHAAKTSIATWCRLPPHGQRGDLPEEGTKLTIQTTTGVQIVRVLEVSTLKYRKERGTAFVVIGSV